MVILAVALVMLHVVGDQVTHREAVVSGTGDGTGAGADLGESAGEAGAIGLGDGSGAEGVTCTSSSSEPFSS